MINIASAIRDLIHPIINEDYTYKIGLFDEERQLYDQQRSWVDKMDTIKSTIANNQRRMIIKTSQSEISNFKGLTHTSFNWFIEVYAAKDDETVLEDLYKIIDDLKETVSIVDDMYKLYLTFTTPLPQISEIDNGVWMRTISFSGAGIICDNAMLSDELKFEISNTEIDTILGWSSGINASGDSYQVSGMANITSSIENISCGIKLKVIYKTTNATLTTLFNYSLGIISTPLSNLKRPLKITYGTTTTTWTNAKILSINTETAKGGIIILTIEIVKE